MPKPPLIRSAFLPYHIHARANNRDWFDVQPEVAWDVFSSLVFNVTVAYGARFHAFVLMPNHFHALVTTPEKNLDRIMNYLMRETARSINRESNRINHVFGGNYKWTSITTAVHYSNTYKYIYRNPVACGLSANVESYPFSTIGALGGYRPLALPLWNPTHGFDQYTCGNFDDLLKWLNAPTKAEHIKQIQAALRRRTFRLPRNNSTLRKTDLDTNLC